MGSRAVLLMNTGSPDSTSVKDVRRFLGEFLMDPHVIDLPWFLRALLVKGIILPRRPKHSAEAYRHIWTDAGSPLTVHTHAIADSLQTRINMPVSAAMRYGNPSFARAIDGLVADGITEIVLLPLFPHYAMATTGSCIDAVKHYLATNHAGCQLTVCPPFFHQPEYLKALQNELDPILADPDQHVLFSFHGLPEKHIRRTDPTGHHCLQSANCCTTDSPAHATCYRAQCLKTVAGLNLPTDRISVAFQSRLGRAKWLRPYTADLIRALPKKGVTKLSVVCPSFVCDCLETLEEIAIQGKEIFLAAGGESLTLIPCPNESPAMIDALAKILDSLV